MCGWSYRFLGFNQLAGELPYGVLLEDTVGIKPRTRVGVIKIVIVINCNLITFFKIIENNCNSVFTLITIIKM